MNHPKFPFGKGLWIWQISKCFNGNLDTIIAKCKEVNLSYVLVKAGDGVNTWDQWTPALIKKFHDAGIKIYSWSFVYGDNPLREAAIAMWALDMGADGHVFDAEGHYEGKPTQAETMLKAVRSHAPDAWLAYSPFPIIDYHTLFPYVVFGKYCDAVIPQVYFGELNKTPLVSIKWMFDQWSKWERKWSDAGHADSIKPIIPAGQAYDAQLKDKNGNITLNYVSTGADVSQFIEGVKGYRSVNFWSFQHVVRADVWEAIKNTNVDSKFAEVEKPAEPVVEKPQETSLNINPPERSAVPEVVTAPESPQVTPDPEPAPIAPVVVAPETTTAATPDPVKESPPKLWGINSHNSISYRVKKRHIDYFLDFVNLILKGLKLYDY